MILSVRSSARLVVGLLIAALVGGVGCQSDEERLAARKERAEQYVAEGNIKEALVELRSALQIDPKNADTNFRIANLVKQQGRLGNAIFFYEEAFRLDPDKSYPALVAISLLLQVGDIDRAEELNAQVLERFPTVALAHVKRSDIALARKDLETALIAALTALELQPDSYDALMQLGEVHRARLAEAEAEPDDATYKAAFSAYDHAMQVGEGVDLVRAQQARAAVLRDWPGHQEEATQAYQDLLARSRNLTEKSDREEAVRMVVRYSEGKEELVDLHKEALEELLTLDEADLRTWVRLADLEAAQGRSSDAVFSTLFERRPDDVEAHIMYAEYLRERDRGSEALAHLEKTAAAGISPPRVLWHLVKRQQEMGMSEDAEATLARMEKDYPNALETGLGVADRHLRNRNPLEAARLLRRLAADHEHVETHRMLADAEYRLGNIPAATAAINRALEFEEGYSIALQRTRAQIQASSGDWVGMLRTIRGLRRRGHHLRPEERLMMARGLYETDYPEEGRKALDKLLSRPRVNLAVILEFVAREGKNDRSRARDLLEKALAVDPQQPAILRHLTGFDLEDGNIAEATERLERAVALGDPPASVYLTQAFLLGRIGEYAKAEEAAEKALDLSPDEPGVMQIILGIYVRQNKIGEAIERLEMRAARGGLPPGYRVMLARLYVMIGQDAKAREAYEQAIAEQDSLSGAKNDLAFLMARTGVDLDRALRLAQEAQRTRGTDPVYADTTGYVYLRKGLAEPALQQFDYAISLAEANDPDSAVMHYHRGLALRALARDQEATQAFERALALDSSFTDADDARVQLEAARAAGSAQVDPG